LRTNKLKTYRQRLAETNDQLCYSYFSHEHLIASIQSIITTNPTQLTSVSFPDNQFAPRINVRNSDLKLFSDKAFFTLGHLTLVTSVEYLLSYLGEIESFRSSILPTQADTIEHEQPEEQLSQKLIAWRSPAPEPIIKTIAYLRLRRNHIAHANEEPHRSLKSLVKDHAHKLTTFWANQPTKLPGLSFRATNFSEFGEQESFSLINLCRATMEIVDDIFCSTIPSHVMENFAANEFARQNRALKGRAPQDRCRKFAAYFRDQYEGTSIMDPSALDGIFASQ
jgi:hypothetical protein